MDELDDAGMAWSRDATMTPAKKCPGGGAEDGEEEGKEEEGEEEDEEGEDEEGEDDFEAPFPAGEDTLRDQLQVMKSLRAARRQQKRAEEGTDSTALVSAEIIVVGAGYHGSGEESKPAQMIIQGCRESVSPAIGASALAAGAVADVTEEVGGVVGEGEGNDASTEENVATLEEALTKAGHGTHVLLKSGVLSLPPQATTVEVPEAMYLRLSSYSNLQDVDGLARVCALWRLQAGSHGAMSCMGLSTVATGCEEVCVSVVGGPWRFLRCEILAAPERDGAWGGVALHTAGLGECYLRSCTVGGSSRRRRSGEAVVIGENSEVRMEKCGVQKARFALVRVVDSGVLAANGCLLRAASYAIGLAGVARVSLLGTGIARMQLAVFSRISADTEVDTEVGDAQARLSLGPRADCGASLHVNECTVFGDIPYLWMPGGQVADFKMPTDTNYQDSSFASSDLEVGRDLDVGVGTGGGGALGGQWGPGGGVGEERSPSGVDGFGEYTDALLEGIESYSDPSAVSEIFEQVLGGLKPSQGSGNEGDGGVEAEGVEAK